MLIPNWQAPLSIKAVCFEKSDSIESQQAFLAKEPWRLQQVHGNNVITLPSDTAKPEADGSYTQAINTVCAIQTADCLAIYLASSTQAEIALLHGGWRGLSQNIIQAGVAAFKSPAHHIHAHLGPAVSAQHYEVGLEVYQAFCQPNPALASAFQATRPGHYLCDLYHIARWQLQQLGVTHITGGEHCTFREADRFYSVRREGPHTGRLLHCLWMVD
jgi:YfiH family protein